MKIPTLLFIALSILPVATTGCTYLQNRRDDLTDIFVLGVGGTVGGGPVPSALGLYLEATEFLHLGGMAFEGYTAGIDRRGYGVAAVRETKLGLGPYHFWRIDESHVLANRYKSGAMAYWESRMGWRPERKQGPGPLGPAYPLSPSPMIGVGEQYGLFHKANGSRGDWGESAHGQDRSIPAKRMRFLDSELGAFPRGWQDWGFLGVDIAIGEPFVLHVGVRARAGMDISQITDFILGILTIDIYGDDATAVEYALADEAAEEPRADMEPSDAAAAPGP
jgi:hypothetical protein